MRKRKGNDPDYGAYLPTPSEIRRLCLELQAKRDPRKVGRHAHPVSGIREFSTAELRNAVKMEERFD